MKRIGNIPRKFITLQNYYKVAISPDNFHVLIHEKPKNISVQEFSRFKSDEKIEIANELDRIS